MVILFIHVFIVEILFTLQVFCFNLYTKILFPKGMLYLNFTLTCKAVCCAIFNKLHHHIFLSYELTQGGAPCDEAAH